MNPKAFIRKNILPVDANRYAKTMYYQQLLNNCFARGAVGAATRQVDITDPGSWAFSAFSQNGEDGIIDFLLTRLNHCSRYFIEIGSGSGLENNSSYLAHVKKFAGLQVEGDSELFDDAQLTRPWLVEMLNEFVTVSSVDAILKKSPNNEPDVFSIDIDGMDYHIVRYMLEKGFRPKILVCEYNSAFGPEASLTLPYDPAFNMFKTDYPYLYYGVSITGWKNLLDAYGYAFITVEESGTNAFFVQRSVVEPGWLAEIKSLQFAENSHQLRQFGMNWQGQFQQMKQAAFIEI